jgi:hypothetical protein
MDFDVAWRGQPAGSDVILNDLSSRQHLAPHQPIADLLDASAAALNFCPNAALAAMDSLRLDPSRKIGRLTRTELIQLPHSIRRYWNQAISSQSAQWQPV